MVDVNGQTPTTAQEPTVTPTLEPSNLTQDPTTESSTTDSASNIEALRRAPFGSRYLTDPSQVYSFNAWDHVVPPPTFIPEALTTLAKQREKPVTNTMKEVYNKAPALYWDRFYKINGSNFFKDRNWLKLEFAELWECAREDAGPKTVVEIGCGAGNTVFPLLAQNLNPQLEVHAFDYAPSAVEVVKSNPNYPKFEHGLGSLTSDVWDLTSPPTKALPTTADSINSDSPTTSDPTLDPNYSSLPPGIKPNSVDVAILIFVLSALHPEEWQLAIANCWKMLKPGGLLLIRDYGRYDLAQLRIKGGRMLDENFYIRGDGTRVYFFEASELSEILTGSKTGYTLEPMTQQPSMEVEVEGDVEEVIPNGSGAGTGAVEAITRSALAADSPMPGTPIGESESLPSGLAKKLEEGLNLGESSTSAIHSTPKSTHNHIPTVPLSTRFRPPSPSSNPTPGPREGFPAIEPSRSFPGEDGEGQGEQLQQELEIPEGSFNPFLRSHEELGIPEYPLFRIDQLGVDRRMMVNRKRQLTMYRIWMQVKARKLVPETEAGEEDNRIPVSSTENIEQRTMA